MRFRLSDRDEGVGMERTALSNQMVVRMFLEDSFPKDKMEIWGTEHLKITKKPYGWALVNYNTPLLYRDSEGNVFWDDYGYSVTTSKIQGMIGQIAEELGITMDVVSGRDEMAEEIERAMPYQGLTDVKIIGIDQLSENAYSVQYEAENVEGMQAKEISKRALEGMTREDLVKYIEEG